MFSAIVSYGFRLGEVALEMGIDPAKDTKVRKGIFGSETWTKEMKQRMSRLWDMETFDIYGSTELVVRALEMTAECMMASIYGRITFSQRS